MDNSARITASVVGIPIALVLLLALAIGSGAILLPNESTAPPGYPYIGESFDTVIRSGDPKVYKAESLYKRRSDGKLLARSVSYRRVGGDFPIFDHHSVYSCPSQSEAIEGQRRIFMPEE
jgi:hypothetical protein